MNEVVLPGIKPVEFGNPTTNPWVDSNDMSAVIRRLGEVQKLGSANKAGAKLRVERAANVHLEILGQIMSGQTVRMDLTEGQSFSVHFGGRRIHVPTFNDYTMSAVQAGVRYAPIQHAVWDEGLKRTRIVGAQESLAHTLRSLMASGIRDLPIAEQASAIARSMEDFRKSGLIHLRFGPQAVGGALPYFLSSQVSLGAQHPATRAAMKVESLIGEAIKSMHTSRVVGGLQESQSYVRQALAHQLAIGLMLFEEGSPIKSTGVKSLRLRGFDPFGGEREIGSEGRLLASTLPSHAYTAFPGEQLAKGLHHRRAVMAMPLQTVQDIRKEGAALRGLRRPKMRASRVMMSSYDVEARRVASQHFGQMGVKLKGGVAQLDTPIAGMFLRPRAGLTTGEQGVAQQLLTLMFGDSSVRPTSPEMTKLAAEQNRFRVIRLQQARGASYATADMHPALHEAISKHGMGGAITLDTPITFEQLGGKSEQVTGRYGPYQRVVERARIGGSLTSTGEVRVSRSGQVLGEYLRPEEEIVGFRGGPGLTQVVVRRRGDVAMQEGTPILLGKKRVSLGTAAKGFRGVDIIGPAGKMGHDLSAPDALVEHIATLVERKGGRKGLRDVAGALGGKLHRRGIFGEYQIRYGDAELFPAGVDGKLNLDKAREVIKVAEKYGIVLGPGNETERRALLEDVFEKGRVDRIQEFYRGSSISQHETGLREFIGPRGQALLDESGRDLNYYLEGVRANTVFGGRAGQPSRGTFGHVAVRMRDMRMYAVGVAATGGADIMSMYRAHRVLGDRFGYKGANAPRIALAYGRMWKNAVERPMGLGRYIEGLSAAAEGRVEKLGGDFEIISLEDYKKRYGSGLNKVPRRSELKDLRGTPFVEEIDGQLRPTRKTLVVQMPEEGAMSLTRKMGGNAVRTSHVVVPSGEALGLRQGEYVNFTRLARRGLKSSLGRSAVRLHGALVGGDLTEAYRVGGATALTGAEHYLGRGGLRHRGGSKIKASFGGTLVADARLDVGEVGVSRKTARELLRRQGFKGADLDAKLRAVESGSDEFFTHFKTEPMRAPEHLTQAKVRIINGPQRVKGPGGLMHVKADQAIRVNPLGLLIRERDFDYDPGYLFNMARKYSGDAMNDFHVEQTALKALWEKNRTEHKAVADVAQQIVARVKQKDASGSLKLRSAEMIADARRIAAEFMGREIKEGAQTVDNALAQVMSATPELLTPIANVRQRTRIQILESIAMGHNLDSMILKGQEGQSRESLLQAMETIRKDIPSLRWLHTTAKASEYTVLKKAHAEQALGDASKMAGAPDSFFTALAADMRLGTARPGTAAAEEEIAKIASPLMDILKLDEGGAHEVAGRVTGLNPEELARRMAVTYQAAAHLERQGVMSAWQPFLTNPAGAGTAIQGSEGFVAQYLKLVEGRDPEFAQRLIAGGHNWGAMTAGVAEASRKAGDEAITNHGGSISSFGKAFAQSSSKMLNALWESKWGKFALGGAGILAAIGASKSLFGGGGGDTHPPGAPMPPPPMLGGVGPERELDYNAVPSTADARIQRVPQVRTHYQVSGRTSGRGDFRGLADGALGHFGRRPVHAGTFVDQTSRQHMRNQIEHEINDRMYSDF